MDAFRKLMSSNTEIPVYVWDRENAFNNIDIDSFILEGAAGVISGDGILLEQELGQISERHNF